MNIDASEDRAFCLAGLTTLRERFKAVLELLPPDRQQDLQPIVSELSAMDDSQRRAEWQRLAEETNRYGDQVAKRELGVSLDELPPNLRQWIFLR